MKIAKRFLFQAVVSYSNSSKVSCSYDLRSPDVNAGANPQLFAAAL